MLRFSWMNPTGIDTPVFKHRYRYSLVECHISSSLCVSLGSSEKHTSRYKVTTRPWRVTRDMNWLLLFLSIFVILSVTITRKTRPIPLPLGLHYTYGWDNHHERHLRKSDTTITNDNLRNVTHFTSNWRGERTTPSDKWHNHHERQCSTFHLKLKRCCTNWRGEMCSFPLHSKSEENFSKIPQNA
jgi:hypothetical protein